MLSGYLLWTEAGWASRLVSAWLLALVLDWGWRNAAALHRILYPYFVAPLLGPPAHILKHCPPGDWAVITGATDGIGKAYALELGRLGANLVLISRNPEKLAKVQAEFQEQLPQSVEIRTVTFDFETPDHMKYEEIRAALTGLRVGALVNCVGATYDEMASVGAVPDGDRLAAQFLNINCLSATLVERGRGAIINICSVAAFFPAPFLAIYGASKAYVGHLTKAMQMEYEGTGIVVQAVYPFFVDTKMGRMKRSWSCPSPGDYARQALYTVGLQDRTFGCFSHSCQGEGLHLLWTWMSNAIFKSNIYDLMLRQQKRKKKGL